MTVSTSPPLSATRRDAAPTPAPAATGGDVRAATSAVELAPTPEPTPDPTPEPTPESTPDVELAPVPPSRGPVRRFLETRGTLGGHHGPHRRRRLHAADGTWLSAVWLPGPAAWRPAAEVPAIVVLHGFAANAAKPAYARLGDELSRRSTVLAVDLRGHGRSDGASTLGDAERHDVAAAVAALRADGHRHVLVLGVSMGATAAVHAAATGTVPDALVLISGPGWLDLEPTTLPLQQLQRHWHSPTSRWVMRTALRVVVADPRGWSAPLHPAEVLPSGIPTLVVHGDDDAYFPPTHAEALAAGDDALLWIEPGFGHAEDGLTPTFCRRLALAIDAQVCDGVFGGPTMVTS